MADTFTKQDQTALVPVAYTITTSETITENFKDLMAEVDARLLEQYSSGRIKGPDYVTVYASAMQTAFQLASQIEIFEAKRASHAKQWKLKAFDSLSSSHSMTSNVSGTVDTTYVFPTLKNTYNDLYDFILGDDGYWAP